MYRALLCVSCRLELQNLQLIHRAQRAESELSDLRAFLSQLLAAASPPAVSHAAPLPGPISPAAVMLAASSEAAATPAFMAQPAAAPASSLLADANTQAAASPVVLGHAAAAAAPSPSMVQTCGSPHGISKGDAAESSGTGQPQTTEPPSLSPGSPLKHLQCSDGQFRSATQQIQSPGGQLISSNGQVRSLDGHTQSCNGQLQSNASPRKPGLPAVDPNLSPRVPNRSASNGGALNPALGVDVTQVRSTGAKGNPQQSSDNASQPLEPAGHMQSGPSPSSGWPSEMMGRFTPPMGSSSLVTGSSRLLVGRSSPQKGSASPIVGTPILCKPAGVALQPIGSPSQSKGKLTFLPIKSANQLPPFPPSSPQPADHSDNPLNISEQSEHDFNTTQLKDNAVATQHEEQLVSDAVCVASPAQQAQRPAQAPSVSCKHSMPSRPHGPPGTTDCRPAMKQQFNRVISKPAVDTQTTSEAATIEIPAPTEDILAVAAVPSEEELQGASGVGRQSFARQQSGGLSALAVAITSKHLPAASRPLSPQGNPSAGHEPKVDAPALCVLFGLDKAKKDPLQQTGTAALMHRSADRAADAVPSSIARVLRHQPHEHTSCTDSIIAEEGRQEAAVTLAAAGDSIIEAADEDTLTHMTDTLAESAAVTASFGMTAEESPSTDEGASQKQSSYTAAELFCMVSDKDSQDVANSQDVACNPFQGHPTQGSPTQGKSLPLDACNSQLQHHHADHVPQLEPAGSQQQKPLTASPQQLSTEHLMSGVEALSLPDLPSPASKQDAQEFAEAARSTADRLEHDEQTGHASASCGMAAKQSEAHDKENRQAVESAIASGEQ